MNRAPDLHRAERMALRVLAARRITALPVEPLSLLHACRDTVVLTLDEASDRLDQPGSQLERLFDRADAVTMRCAEKYLIIYRPGGNPARLRFTLAHELGHRLLGHEGADPAEEREADHFASHLLCPEPVLARLRERFGIVPIQRVATGFYVSSACARAVSLRPASSADPTLLRQVEMLLAGAADALCAD